MTEVCSPVTVVTTMAGNIPHGTTVSAFASLSLHPPLVTIALDRNSNLLRLVRQTGRIGINVLAHGQEDAATRFARKGDDAFDGLSWHPDDGLPRLDTSVGWLACDVKELVEGGDHCLLIAAVRAASPGQRAPLIYHRRVFGTHSALVTH